MSVAVSTGQPQAVLSAIYRAIDEGHIRTWRYQDANQIRWLTHSAQQWDARAWFKATVLPGTLVFNISAPPNQTVELDVYAIYHGRLVEMLIGHFANQISNTSASPQPVVGDRIAA